MKTIQNAAWRISNNGIQMYCSLWWCAAIAPSEHEYNKWWWKTVLCNPPEGLITEGYTDSMEGAYSKVMEALPYDSATEYKICKSGGHEQYIDYLNRLQIKRNKAMYGVKEPEYSI